MKVNCPICKKESVFGEPDFPFCSERCRTLDLGNWAAERYVISTPIAALDIAAEEEDDGG